MVKANLLKTVSLESMISSNIELGINPSNLESKIPLWFDTFDKVNVDQFKILLKDKLFRDSLTCERLMELKKIREVLCVSNAENNVPNTISKNLKVFQNSIADKEERRRINPRVDMMNMMSYAATCNLPKDRYRLLMIGPRSEYEILSALAYGFKNIIAIDLFSYSPFINVCDLHDLEGELFFNGVIMGYVLPYLSEPKQAITEITSMLQPGGTLTIGSTRTTSTLEDWNKSNMSEVAKYTKVVFSTEDELTNFIEESSNNALYEISRGTLTANTGTELYWTGMITCTYQKESNQKMTSRKGAQVAHRLDNNSKI